jgi:hypothetical protein
MTSEQEYCLICMYDADYRYHSSFYMIPDTSENKDLLEDKSSVFFDMFSNGDLQKWKVCPGTIINAKISRCIAYDECNY